MAGVYGAMVKAGIGTSSLAVGNVIDFQSENIALNEELIDTGGLRGTRSHASERVRRGRQRIAGTLTVAPTAVELAALLPWVLGAAASGTTYALAETLPERYVFIQRGDGSDGKVFEYPCKVNRCTFRAGPGTPLTLAIDVVARTETVTNANTFPAGTIDVSTGPFVFTDLVASIGGSNYAVADFEVVVDNALDAERFHNATTLAAIYPQDRTVSVNLTPPYGDAEALYAVSASVVNTVLTFTNGNTSCVFTMPGVHYPMQSPTVAGLGEIMLPLRGTARKVTTTEALVITLDSTP